MSVRKAQTDFYSPMTGNVFGEDRRRNDLIMKAIKTEMIKTDDPFTQIGEKKSYAPQDDPASIADAFDRDYGVLSDEEAAVILEENKKKIEEPTPVIEPEPTPTPTPTPDPKPEVKPENTPEKAVEKATEYKKKGREAFMGNSARTMRLRANAKRKAQQAGTAGGGGRGGRTGASSSSSSRGSSTGRGGARGGSTGGRGASSKGGTGKGGSTGRGGSRGGSTGGSGASKKGGTSKGGARTNRSKSRRRCDIRCKFDISLLTNMNLVNDDLATLAYFVQEIQK
jgi:outer membrane biosynthesis protein TonB